MRGSKLPIHVPRQANADTVHKFAIEKHSHYDQFFCGLEDWTLLYPDQKKVDIIPGTKMHFNVERYKKELAKPFSKIDLYLCMTHQVKRGELNRLKYELTKPVVYDDDDDEEEFDPDQFLTSIFSEPPLEQLPTVGGKEINLPSAETISNNPSSATDSETQQNNVTKVEFNSATVTESNLQAVSLSIPTVIELEVGGRGRFLVMFSDFGGYHFF